MKAIIQLVRNDEAATAVEYAVMLGLILIAVISAISTVGVGTGGIWSNNASELNNAFNRP